MASIVRPYIVNCLARGDSVEHGDTGECRSSPPFSSGTRNFDAFRVRTRPGFVNAACRGLSIGWQPEVGPSYPPTLPGDRRWLTSHEVQSERWFTSVRKRLSQPPAADKPARRECQHSRRPRFPCRHCSDANTTSVATADREVAGSGSAATHRLMKSISPGRVEAHDRHVDALQRGGLVREVSAGPDPAGCQKSAWTRELG